MRIAPQRTKRHQIHDTFTKRGGGGKGLVGALVSEGGLVIGSRWINSILSNDPPVQLGEDQAQS